MYFEALNPKLRFNNYLMKFSRGKVNLITFWGLKNGKVSKNSEKKEILIKFNADFKYLPFLGPNPYKPRIFATKKASLTFFDALFRAFCVTFCPANKK